MDSKQISEIINRVIDTSPHRTRTESEARETLIALGLLDSDGELTKEGKEVLVKIKK